MQGLRERCCHEHIAKLALTVMPQALSQSKLSWSSRMRMSSATAIVGCVSFIWKTALSGSSSKLLWLCLKRATTSCEIVASGHAVDRGYKGKVDWKQPFQLHCTQAE